MRFVAIIASLALAAACSPEQGANSAANSSPQSARPSDGSEGVPGYLSDVVTTLLSYDPDTLLLELADSTGSIRSWSGTPPSTRILVVQLTWDSFIAALSVTPGSRSTLDGMLIFPIEPTSKWSFEAKLRLPAHDPIVLVPVQRRDDGTYQTDIFADQAYQEFRVLPFAPPRRVSGNLGDAPMVSWDIDGDGAVTAARDGQIVLRYLSGQTGSMLTSGLDLFGALRNNAESLETYLNASDAQYMLDVDADGELSAERDGYLLLRHLAGFSDDELMRFMTNAAATRADALSVVQHIRRFLPTPIAE